MQKSKNATIIIIVILLIYGLIGSLKLVKEINVVYLYIINPIFWISFAFFLYFAFGKSIENKKLQKTIIQYTVIAVLTYIIIYLLSGLVVTFGRNPYSTTFKGVLINLWIFGTIIIAKEYIRFKIIDNVYERDKTFIAIFISVIYIIIDLELNRLMEQRTTLSLIKFLIQNGVPIVAQNIVFSYTARYSNILPAIIYRIITNLYFWVSPILPNSPWVMTAIIDTTIPVILFLYIRYTKNKLDKFRTKEKIINSDPKSIIPLVIMIVLAIWFAIGIFPIKPVAIASGSMEKEIYVGDIAIIKKCNPNDVNVGDIIEYQMEGYTVIHRIIEKTQRDGEFFFVTKGDNNKQPDNDEVREGQLIGKVIFKVRYLGFPAIWLHLIQANEQMVEVET